MMLQFGILCALLSIPQLSKATEQAQADMLVCETDYWLNISCFLNSSAIPNRTENVLYWLEFNIDGANEPIFPCSLLVRKDGYSCMFTAQIKFQSSFMTRNRFDIRLCYQKNELKTSSFLNSNYRPAKHIKPITPYNVTVQYVDEQYNFAWKSGYEKHPYVQVLPFQYILRYHKEGQSSMKDLHTNQTVFSIPEVHLDPDTEYIAKVYNKVIQTAVYGGTKSHGSTEIRWKTVHTGKAGASVKFGATGTREIVIPICLAVGLSFLLLYPVARKKIKKIAWMATPAPYFQQFNLTHQANLQGWVSKCHVQQTYSEEMSTIDVISEVTAGEQHEAKNSNIHSQTQFHTPYVGPSMEAWVPGQTFNSHITANNPCNDLDFLPEECAVEETTLCLITAKAVEGFLCLEDLESIHEICQPSEALTITPKPACVAQNYCTLINTAIGLIPTFSGGLCDLNTLTEPLNMQIEGTTPELITVTLDNLELSIEE